jgi:hypothetical protein
MLQSPMLLASNELLHQHQAEILTNASYTQHSHARRGTHRCARAAMPATRQGRCKCCTSCPYNYNQLPMHVAARKLKYMGPLASPGQKLKA